MIRKFCQITAMTIVAMGTITIGIGTFSSISCTTAGIIAVGIGLLMRWATDSIC